MEQPPQQLPRRANPMAGPLLFGLTIVAIAPLMTACLAVAFDFALAGLTGVAGARSSGFRQEGLYYIMVDKPPVPRAVPAGLWWASYGAQTTALYAMLVVLVESVAIAVAVQLFIGVRGLGRFVRRGCQFRRLRRRKTLDDQPLRRTGRAS